jgi:hypothetical protein
LLYPLSYEGGARLDPYSYRARLPILAGGRPVLLVGLDLRNMKAAIGRASAAGLSAWGESATAWEPASCKTCASQSCPCESAS